MTGFDFGVIAIYLAGLLAFGALLSRRKASPNEFFLAAQNASWPAIGLAMMGTNVSPGVLIGVTGSAYAFGISVYNYDWMASVILALFAVVFLPVVLAARVYTMPEFLERRFDWRVRMWFSALSLFLCIFLDAAGALYCGALVLRFLFPALPFIGTIITLAIISVIYSVSGGLRAVLYTQAAQALTVLGTALLLAGFAFDKAGGWHQVMTNVPQEALSLIRPASDPYMPWTGLVFGAPILAFYFWCTNQSIVQRMLAARSVADGQKGALLAGLLKLTTLFVIVMPGIAGRVLYPDLKQADDIYLQLAFGVMPAGLLGLLLAAFLGALMAQLSASYNSAATLVTMDFVKRRWPDISDRKIVSTGRLATIVAMVLSAMWAPQILHFPSLWQYFQAVLAYATPPVVALFLGGLLWRRANANGAIWTTGLGSLIGLTLFVLSATGVWKLPFLVAAVLVFLASCAILGAVSLITPRSSEEAGRAEAMVKSFRATKPRLNGVTVFAAGLIVVTGVVVILFW
nr:sodium/solute symporter [Rhizomicrobium palustre]